MDAPVAHAEQQRRCQNQQRQDDEDNKPRDTAWLTKPEVHHITQRKQQIGQRVPQHTVPKTQPDAQITESQAADKLGEDQKDNRPPGWLLGVVAEVCQRELPGA